MSKPPEATRHHKSKEVLVLLSKPSSFDHFTLIHPVVATFANGYILPYQLLTEQKKMLNLYREEKVNSLNYSKISRQLLAAFAYFPGSNPSFINSLSNCHISRNGTCNLGWVGICPQSLKFKNMFVCLFVTEEITITVSRRAPDKEARPSPYHYFS